MATSTVSCWTRCKQYNKDVESLPTGTLALLDLTAYGIAAVVGSGIFATVGRVAHKDAGLAAPLSVLIAGGLSLATAICYLEFASALPTVSGSSYAYFYGGLGEVWAWMAGWNMTLEYAFAAAAIACAWSDGIRAFLESVGVGSTSVPDYIFKCEWWGITVYPVAAGLVLLIGALVSRGVKMGARLTNAVSILNVTLIVLIIAVGACFVRPSANWFTAPFVHPQKGWPGVLEGGSRMFFAYIGYDTVSTLAADAVAPARDVPVAVLLTLGIATVLYIGVACVLTGMQRWETLSAESSLVRAFQAVKGAHLAAPIVSIGSLTTMAATVMACLLGQPKIFRAMAEDGLLPTWLAGSEASSLFTTVMLTGGLALFVDFNDPSSGINDAICFGVLLGMSAICAALLIVRFRQRPELEAAGTNFTMVFFAGCLIFSFLLANDYARDTAWVIPVSFIIFVISPFVFLASFYRQHSDKLPSLSKTFTCPAMPLLPAVAILANSMVLMTTWQTAIVPFAVWTGIGLVMYVGYGRINSKLV